MRGVPLLHQNCRAPRTCHCAQPNDAVVFVALFARHQVEGRGGVSAGKEVKWRCAEVSLSGRPGNHLTGGGPSLPLRLGLEGVRQDFREVT